jgi:hypothetical protein
MTKEQFLNGTPFRVKGIHNSKGSATFTHEGGVISKQIRSSVDERKITDDYHLNVLEVSDKGFTGFVYVMNKQINISYKFKDLVEFIPVGE